MHRQCVLALQRPHAAKNTQPSQNDPVLHWQARDLGRSGGEVNEAKIAF
jgi:hypothetical protein